ncbi:hypothetical protein [Agromyces sp. NBRC 114283]|uniref:hypothetical protein n=1 Tax=Agromyces sp. NBRC 114283 TaxID=2994521 RepID=UPI0024A03FB4|nr:hypothetical protein [Agromyces sp. NBRC 114283]GLU88583.1 hypothetical protein Agsp01_08380 [Agromyces sp. NBRC 114283]
MERRIAIGLTEDEVLVLFEWLHRINESPQIAFEDQAEQRAAWDLEAMLESANPALFAGDYRERLQAARDRVRDTEG